MSPDSRIMLPDLEYTDLIQMNIIGFGSVKGFNSLKTLFYVLTNVTQQLPNCPFELFMFFTSSYRHPTKCLLLSIVDAMEKKQPVSRYGEGNCPNNHVKYNKEEGF